MLLGSQSALTAPVARAQESLAPAANAMVDQLLATKELVRLALSPNGETLLYVLRALDASQDTYVTSLWRLSTRGDSPPIRVTNLPVEAEVEWAPDGTSAAFLSSHGGTLQIWLWSSATDTVEQLTNVPGGVASFRWSPDGRRIAYLATADSISTVDPVNWLTTPRPPTRQQTGVLIDRARTWFGELLSLEPDPPCRPGTLWQLEITTRSAAVLAPDVSLSWNCRAGDYDYAWSPDGARIAIAGTVGRSPDTYTRGRDIIVAFPDGTRPSATLLSGAYGPTYDQMVEYGAPFWLSDGQTIVATRKSWRGRWSTWPTLQLFSASSGLPARATATLSTALSQLYRPRPVWAGRDLILIEATQRATRQLHAVDLDLGTIRALFGNLGHTSHFSVSADGTTIAFVAQSPTLPPEVFVARLRSPADPTRPVVSQLTSINQRLRTAHEPLVRRLTWRSYDGALVEGWLLLPPGYSPARTYPVLTFLHGGPATPLTNRYRPYFEYWPYLFTLFAARGYAVFMPNYRLTHSFAPSYTTVEDFARSPVDDILAGIDTLLALGLADATKLGILGHSHGGYLAALAMTRRPTFFAAAAIAEGFADAFLAYTLNPMLTAVPLLEYYFGNGASPYTNPHRWIEVSPVFHLACTRTPVLLEYGDLRSNAMTLDGFALAAALWRHAIPHELIVYPSTGHNPRRPSVQRESITRNLDWFDYWLLERRDTSVTKTAQYARWQRMRSQREKHTQPPGTDSGEPGRCDT